MKYLQLKLSVEAGTNEMSGNSLLDVQALAPMDSLILEFRDNMIVDSVFINSEQKTFTHINDHILIPFGETIPTGSAIHSSVYYHGNPSPNGVFSGSYNGLTYTASLSESYQAREWFPVKQILTDKIDSADIWIKTSSSNLAGSNGRLIEVIDSPDGKKEFHWHSKHPIDYYLVSYSVGDYQEYINYAKPEAFLPDSIPVIHYLSSDPGYLNAVKANLDKTPKFIEKFSELYGLYPFADEKYGHTMANIGGGMEHQTMSTMVSFGSTLIAHELAHQWWGDHVTCAQWNYIWLNEGFASYSEYLAIEKLPGLFSGITAAQYMSSFHNSAMSQPGGSVYVPLSSTYDENRIFSGRLTYDKGAAIIHTLRWEMQSDTLFFNTLKSYMQQYGGSTATVDDFKQVAETISGRSFNDFFDQWYYGEGYPTFNITYFRQGIDSISLLVNQTTSKPSVTPFFKGLYQLKIQSGAFDTTVVIQLDHNNQFFNFHFSNTVTGVVVDPNNWVMNKVGTITNGGVLPVNIIGFSVDAIPDCNARINWSADHEIQVNSYNIEVSEQGTLFQEMGHADVTGSGNYQIDIPLTTGHYFIRLVIKNKDGSIQYFDTAEVNIVCGRPSGFTVSPNPVSKDLMLNFWWDKDQQIDIRITDEWGRKWMQLSKMILKGSNKIVIPVSSLPKAVYAVTVYDGSRKNTVRFVKL